MSRWNIYMYGRHPYTYRRNIYMYGKHPYTYRRNIYMYGRVADMFVRLAHIPRRESILRSCRRNTPDATIYNIRTKNIHFTK
jgi:hypothetical protein